MFYLHVTTRLYYNNCQGLSSFFIKPIIGSNKKYVKINGMIAVIKGNIKLLNISFNEK